MNLVGIEGFDPSNFSTELVGTVGQVDSVGVSRRRRAR